MAQKLRDRLKLYSPVTKDLEPILDKLITAVNELLVEKLRGNTVHKVSDGVNVITHIPTIAVTDDIIDLEQELIDDYELHIAATTYHLAADSTNVVTELGVAKEAYTLLDEIKADYNAHRILTAGGVHAGTDAVNVVSAANATTKALAVALSNAIRTAFVANFANVTSHHGAVDTTGVASATAVGVLTSVSTWTQICAAADALRAAYEAHRVLTAGAVHGLADSTNTVTAGAVGTVTTALYAGLNELKADFNAHVVDVATIHKERDEAHLATAATASTVANASTLVNNIRQMYVDHISAVAEVAVALVPTLDEA